MRSLRLLIREAEPPYADPLGHAVSWSLFDESVGLPLAVDRTPRDSQGQELPETVANVLRQAATDGPVLLRLCNRIPRFDSVGWEALCGSGMRFENVLLVRQEGDETSDPIVPFGNPRILVAWSDVGNAQFPPLPRTTEEATTIVEQIRRLRSGALVQTLPHATRSGLAASLSGAVDLLHFSGHAHAFPTDHALVLESGEIERAAFLYGEDLRSLVATSKAKVVVLSACRSLKLGYELVRAGLPCAVAYRSAVADSAASLFSRVFYTGLAMGRTIVEAVHEGRLALQAAGEDAFAPVLICRPGAETSIIFASTNRPRTLARSRPPQDSRPFFGREVERERILRALRRPEVRIASITGMGGMGKTRLAMALAADLEGDYRDGTAWIDCSDLRTLEDLLGALAAAIGLGSVGDADEIVGQLSEAETLVVFDCFERLTDHAPYLEKLVRLCQRVDLLVTSRRVLGVPQEHEHAIGPLLGKGRAKSREGIELFAQAARQVSPNFKVNRRNAKLVREVVEALELVPLAIILAAGRLRSLTLDELAEQVRRRRLEVLRRRAIETDRHATMLQVVSDSFDLLQEEERELMFDLSVFQGGFGFADAAAVLAHHPDLLDGIERLRENSLLSVQTQSSAARYRILDTIREYVGLVVPPERLRGVQIAHANHFARFADRWDARLRAGEWKAANEALWSEAGNLRGAVSSAIVWSEEALVLRLAGSLARWYLETGLKTEFESLVEAAEGPAADHEDRRLLIEIRGLQGERRRRDREAPEAIRYWLDRARLCEAINDFDGTADSYTDIASLGLVSDRPHISRRMLRRIDALPAEQISPLVRATAKVIQAKLHLRKDELELAIEEAEAAEALANSVPPNPQVFFIVMSLAQIYRAAGNLDQSLALAKRLVSLTLQAWHLQSVGRGLLEMADTFVAMRRIPSAAEAIAIASQIPVRISPTVSSTVRDARTEFARLYGEAEMESALAAATKEEWRVLAGRLAAAELRAEAR